MGIADVSGQGDGNFEFAGGKAILLLNFDRKNLHAARMNLLDFGRTLWRRLPNGVSRADAAITIVENSGRLDLEGT